VSGPPAPHRSLRVLLVEDTEDDSILLLRELASHGYVVDHVRVDTGDDLRAALAAGPWDLVVSDYSMPQFTGLDALRIVKASGTDAPFLIVSGTIGEEVAVEALKSGAQDFLVKGRLARLVPAIERELREVESRRRQRRAEEALRASEERFRTLVESMQDIVFTIDSEGRHDGVFGRWLEREGLSPDRFLGRTFGEILGADAARPHERAIARALAGESVVYEWSHETPGGTRHFQTSLAPRRDAHGAVLGVVGVGRDLTDERRVHAQLVVSDRMASVGLLAAGIAHEINNPLAAVLANVHLAMRDVADLSESVGSSPQLRALVDELGDVDLAAQRIRDIVRDLKLFSRADSERRGPIDLHKVLDSTLRMAGNELRHRADVVKTYGVVPLVDGDESRLGQVFLNLFINAAQAMPEGRASENRIEVSTAVAADGRVLVRVSDTGAGMPPEVVRRLFTPFFTTKPIGVGTGLGLSICHRIVTSLGGEIAVNSAPGVGTTFTVMLLPASATVAEPAPAPAAAPVVGSRGRVLVVDDDPMVAAVVRRILASDHDLTSTTSAQHALDLCSGGERYDVILCDLMMPQMTGMDLHAALSQLAPDQAQRMLFFTGGAFTERARSFLDQVENLRLEKPFDATTLRTLIATRLRQPSGA
jgi:PAS domain S-box-containing protein